MILVDLFDSCNFFFWGSNRACEGIERDTNEEASKICGVLRR